MMVVIVICRTKMEVPNQCIFCTHGRKNQKTKRKGSAYEGLTICESPDIQASIQRAAVELADANVLGQIKDADMTDAKVKYHISCKKKYLQKVNVQNVDPAPITMHMMLLSMQ